MRGLYMKYLDYQCTIATARARGLDKRVLPAYTLATIIIILCEVGPTKNSLSPALKKIC